MISYSLKCTHNHRFESWFQSAEAFEKLRVSGMLHCSVCGSSEVEKSLMAPQVRTSRKRAAPDDLPQTQMAGQMPEQMAERPLSGERTAAEQALAELRKKIVENSEHVGRRFVQEARDIHEGLAPARPIYGEARLEEAKKLIEDGVSIVPLPFTPDRNKN